MGNLGKAWPAGHIRPAACLFLSGGVRPVINQAIYPLIAKVVRERVVVVVALFLFFDRYELNPLGAVIQPGYESQAIFWAPFLAPSPCGVS